MNNLRVHSHHCSFCGKSQTEVTWMVLGPTVFICDECVDLCKQMITDGHAAPGGLLKNVSGERR